MQHKTLEEALEDARASALALDDGTAVMIVTTDQIKIINHMIKLVLRASEERAHKINGYNFKEYVNSEESIRDFAKDIRLLIGVDQASAKLGIES